MLRTLFFLLILPTFLSAQNLRERGVEIGVLKTGKNNAITDVKGVQVGQVSIHQGDSVRTGVTAIIPHPGNVFQEKVPAAMYLGNGFGKLTGFSQVEELGNIETPIILTNTLRNCLDFGLRPMNAGFLGSDQAFFRGIVGYFEKK